jgi:putative hydrolase of the HAD superfamily
MSAESTPAAVRAVTFDVGHTLLFPEPSLGEVYAAVAARHGIRIAPALAQERFLIAWTLVRAAHTGLVYGTDHAHALAFWRRVVRLVFDGQCPDGEALDRFLGALYDTFSEPHAWRLHADWPDTLRGLRARGLRVGLLSNWDVRLRGLLEKLGLDRQVDAVVISAEHALEKPDPALFRVALAALAVPAAACLHVGDTWAEDVLGARAAGMQAAWLNPDAAVPSPDPAVPRLATPGEVLRLL